MIGLGPARGFNGTTPFDVSERNDFKLESLMAAAGRVGPGYGKRSSVADKFDELAIPRTGYPGSARNLNGGLALGSGGKGRGKRGAVGARFRGGNWPKSREEIVKEEYVSYVCALFFSYLYFTAIFIGV